jgi:1,4-alpha-glucan branching enzyme
LPKGYIAFVLHTHIPYVLGQGSWPHGEDWLYEATAECYIPLIDTFLDMRDRGINLRLTMGITPVLGEQLASPGFPPNLQSYLHRKIDGSANDEQYFRNTGQTELALAAAWWHTFYQQIFDSFSGKLQYRLLPWLQSLAQSGHLELLTSSATHAYLPLLSTDQAVSAQIQAGVACFQKLFSFKPRGVWLPECAYRPRGRWINPLNHQQSVERAGIDEYLAHSNLQYCVLDTHLLTGREAIGTFREKFQALKRILGSGDSRLDSAFEQELTKENSPFEPYWMLNARKDNPPQVTALIRDMITGLQVWSGDFNYPRDGWYMDFGKKHFPGGNRYWRITDISLDMVHKEPYEPNRASEKAKEHAAHFVSLCRRIADEYSEAIGRPALIVAPFDTELFGHWWREGVEWLAEVQRLAVQDQTVAPVRLGDFCDQFPARKGFPFPAGSWGEGGGDWTWMNERTRWIWELIYQAEKKMSQLVSTARKRRDQQMKTILTLCAQELMLLEASDWPYLVTTLEAPDYASLRVSNHYENFNRLLRIAEDYLPDQTLAEYHQAFLTHLSLENDFLGPIDPDWYLPR